MNVSHKRKRGVRPVPTLETPEQRENKCRTKYHHVGIELARALKKALTFEIQKLTKRLKKARETGEGEAAQARLTEEFEAAKSLGTDAIATYYLRHTIVKSHAKLATVLELKHAGLAPHREASDATKNVVARVLGSKVFKDSISLEIEKLEIIAGLAQPKKTRAKSTKKVKPVVAAPGESEGPEQAAIANDTSAEDSGDEDMRLPAKVSTRVARLDLDPIIQSSTFLPSLQSGYLPADNDSDDEGELKGLFPAQKKERKNRRGQRARRKILEAKHGSKANHIIKERETAQRDYEERVARRAAREMARSGANAIAIEEAEKNRRERRELQLRPIHGSWAIAKAQKEKMKTAKPQGVKISFD